MPDKPLPEWDALLSSAAHRQKIVPAYVLMFFEHDSLPQNEIYDVKL